MRLLKLPGRLFTTLALISAVVILTGCVGLPMACGDLQAEANRLRTLPYGRMNRSDLRAWAVQEYGIDDSSISSSWTSDGAMDLGWSMPGWARYVARFELDGEGPLQQVEVYWSGVNLTAGRAAECLGSPQAYETYYPSQPPRSLVIKLWYADQTLALQSLGAAVPNPDGTVRVDGSLVMTGMTVGLPRPTGTVTSTQALLHAWPGDWPGTRPIDRMR